ncbi:hypothetical protein CORT_0B03840 [Candida orthopsilosis Co 90-125]|uniref:candidapepsin n=1 Tax=Candida orthopsilosis (strain 90-125) TaxID=1136231 RepID=H8X152_CANO9|nr:hypothetical protein CORT_0B03840 [Candida orthopsilosis Co 90-125]CCG22092.1 hypothetical protein CORT_0B03840 [Candida orthopsilosis Co 90-125]
MRVINTVSIAAILASWLPLVTSVTRDVPPGSFKVEFNIRRGSARDMLSPNEDSSPKFVKREEDGSFEIELVNEKTFYLADLYIGSNKDKNEVLVDTGSSDLWVMSHDLFCYGYGYRRRKRDAKNVVNVGTGPKFIEEDEVEEKPTKSKNANKAPVNKAEESAYYSYTYLTDYPEASDYPEPSYDPYSYYSYDTYYGGSNTCTSYGTFNTENSDSFVQNDTDTFVIGYADGTFASGIWGRDTVRIGNLSVEDLSFAVANESSSDIGVLGIGLPGLEVTNEDGGYMYENLPLKMKTDGVIKKALYSLYLDKADAKAGSILFGAVDHAKYEGTLETLKLRNTYEEYDYPVKFEVPVDRIAVYKNGKTTTVLSSTEGVVLDSGSTLSYLRSEQIEDIADTLDGVYSYVADAYTIDCDYEKDTSTTLDISFGNSTIRVPVADLVIESTSGSTCYLGLFEQSLNTSYILFGDNVLRNAYVVYDLEDNEVHISQAYYTDDEDIEIVEQNVPTEGGQKPTSTEAESSNETESGNTSESTSESSNESESESSSSSDSSSTGSNGKKNIALSMYSVSWNYIVGGLLASFVLVI